MNSLGKITYKEKQVNFLQDILYLCEVYPSNF